LDKPEERSKSDLAHKSKNSSKKNSPGFAVIDKEFLDEHDRQEKLAEAEE